MKNKAVINNRYGGFGLSHKAVLRFYELEGTKVFWEGPFGVFKSYHYTLIKMPQDIREGIDQGNFGAPKSNKWLNENALESSRDIIRHNKNLVQAVEELGKEANGQSADLVVEEFEGDKYRVTEYDGYESLNTPETDALTYTTIEG